MASDSPNSSKVYSTDPALYVYTSLTAGSSHIVTATSRLETILRANRVPFKAIDIATDEKARMLWGRRAGKDEEGRMRKLPGLVQMGMVLGDLVEIEDWNEYGELKQHVKIYYDEETQPPISQAPKTAPAAASAPAPAKETGATAVAATKPPPPAPPMPSSSSSSAADKEKENQPSSLAGGEQRKSAIGSAAATLAQVTLPIRSIAEEAAQKAKQVHLQSLRDKVYGKGGGPATKDGDKADKAAEDKETTSPGEKSTGAAAAQAAAPTAGEQVLAKDTTTQEQEVEGKEGVIEGGGAQAEGGEGAAADSEADAAAGRKTPPPADGAPLQSTISIVSSDSTSTVRAAGLQSPTTGTWKTGRTSTDGVPLQTLQSPTSGTWQPTDVEAPIRSLHGSIVASASEEEIAAVEQAQAIPEEPEREEEEEEAEETERREEGGES